MTTHVEKTNTLSKKQLLKLNLTNFKLAEYARATFAITPAAGTTVENLLQPEYWSHVSAKMPPHSRIEAIAEDNTWFAELLVLSSGVNWAAVRLLRHVVLEAAPAKNEDEYEIVFAGVEAKHRVRRKSDKTTLKEGFPTRAEAVKWMQEYEVANLISA